MITLLNETIQLIHITSDTKVSPEMVKHALVSAKVCKNYAKFYTDKFYITVNFNKDNTMSVSHNIRNLDFYRELMRIQNNNRNNSNISLYAQFISRWINKIRKGNVY